MVDDYWRFEIANLKDGDAVGWRCEVRWMSFSVELEWLMIIGDLKFQNVRHVEAGGLLAKALRREEKNFFSFQFSVLSFRCLAARGHILICIGSCREKGSCSSGLKPTQCA
jgi:hypothetical protein